MAEKRDINGILLLNKPVGCSSNRILQRVKRLFNARKAGHTGSLDPLASGMLPICFGEATKYSQFLLDADKCYRVTGLLGVKTTTADSEGEVTQKVCDVSISLDELNSALNAFIGHSNQVPSMYSALKHKGQPLYKLARQGKSIARKARPIVIDSLELLDFSSPTFSMVVRCSKGTYIRNLVEDIGDMLGVGAHVTQLHRLYSMPYDSKPMYDIETLESKACLSLLLPLDTAIKHLPIQALSDEQCLLLQQGQKVRLDQSLTPALYRVYDQQGIFWGVAEWLDEIGLKSKRMLSASAVSAAKLLN